MHLRRTLVVLIASLSVPACFVETRHPVGESRSCGAGQHWEGGSCRGDGHERDKDRDRDHDKGRDKDHDKDRNHDNH